MKAGTTTLYEDLARVPGIYLPPEKEPGDLINLAVETEHGRARYASKFMSAPVGAICGEASTVYAKRPTHEGVAARAKRVLGPDLKIIYLTRDPVKRIVSQYRHLWGLGLENRSLVEAVLKDETYVAYSQYEWQIQPWRERFGDSNVFIMAFEEYLRDRHASLCRVCNYLGVTPPEKVTHTHRNASEGKRILRRNSLWSWIAQSDFYLYQIKPLLPTSVRDGLKAALLPRAKPMEEQLTPEVHAELERRLACGQTHERDGGAG